MMMNKGKHKTS